MVTQLKHYVQGNWIEGDGETRTILNPATEEVIAEVNRDGIDYGAALEYARSKGNPALRNRTFEERGALLQKMSGVIHEHRDQLLELATKNGGNTRGDAKFDVDGAMYALSHYADLGKSLGDRRFFTDGELQQVTRSPRYAGGHIKVPFTGAAVQINAFNFPAWGFGEKTACAFLAGMPVVVKPATVTAPLATRVIRHIIEADVLPEGVITLISGGRGRKLVQEVTSQDVLSFTGSGQTGAQIRGNDHLLNNSVRVNVEADSINAVVLAPDVDRASDTYDLFLLEAVREMTQKAGQKCTATRRILVPENRTEQVIEDLSEELRDTTVGDPSLEEVDMGPVVSRDQYNNVREGLDQLSNSAEVVYDGDRENDLQGVDDDQGFFVHPKLLKTNDPENAEEVHTNEVFGPVSTIVPYSGTEKQGAELVQKGNGALVSTVYSNDPEFFEDLVFELAPYSGRVVLGSDRVKNSSTGPGAVLPALVHGGPGTAGGGEELGGLRGLDHYLQRTAIQGFRPLLEELGNFEE